MKRAIGAALIFPAGVPLGAQWLNHPTPGIPRTADGKPNLAARAPRTRAGKPDLDFVFPATGSHVEFVKDAGGKVTHLFIKIVEGDVKAD